MKFNKIAASALLVASASLLHSGSASALTYTLNPNPIVLPPAIAGAIEISGTFDFDGANYSNINLLAKNLTPGNSAPAGVTSVNFTTVNPVNSGPTNLQVQYNFANGANTTNAYSQLNLNFAAALTGLAGDTASIKGIGSPGFSNYFYNNDLTATAFTKGFPTGTTANGANGTNVPFEFSPEQGFMLGVPLFMGLRQLKKRTSAKKQIG